MAAGGPSSGVVVLSCLQKQWEYIEMNKWIGYRKLRAGPVIANGISVNIPRTTPYVYTPRWVLYMLPESTYSLRLLVKVRHSWSKCVLRGAVQEGHGYLDIL